MAGEAVRQEVVDAIDLHASFGDWVNGSWLSEADWRFRHRLVLWILWLHLPLLFLFGIAGGDRLYAGAHFVAYTWQHSFLEAGVVGIFAALATVPQLNRRLRAAMAGLGLISASAILVHFSGGYIEAHFHFFVMVGLASIYADWVPYAATVAFVTIHHGIVGTLQPEAVFNHEAAYAYPWQWAAIHAAFILMMASTQLANMVLIAQRLRAHNAARQERLEQLI